ncbi:Cyclopropane-fatty-acyl-phospholipid synthase, partial [Leucoagaricus sp. SymC.cos]
ARSKAFSVLEQGVKKGCLIVEDDAGEYQFGKTGDLTVFVKVKNDNLWTRLLLSYNIGFAEAYMHGDFEVSDLRDLLNLWLDNRTTLTGLSSYISTLCQAWSSLAIYTLGRQNLAKSIENVDGYNVSNDFMQCFLSKEMMYSCAMWSDEEGGPDGDLIVGSSPGDLEAAQLRKIRHILRLALAKPGKRLLEIGTGWGAMAIEAARLGCQVDSVTLSVEQKALAEERIKAAGLEGQVRVHLCDYRQLPPEFKNFFDSFISCEMIEAVGLRQYKDYFGMIDWALKKNNAAAVITATSQPEDRYTDYQPEDFARHYHWPNTYLPSATSLVTSVQSVVPGKLVFRRLEDHGIHYPRTLREWGRRLRSNFKGDVVLGMQERYPMLKDPQLLDAFVKKWLYMFVYAEVGFTRAYTSLNCWTLARPVRPFLFCPEPRSYSLQETVLGV